MKLMIDHALLNKNIHKNSNSTEFQELLSGEHILAEKELRPQRHTLAETLDLALCISSLGHNCLLYHTL